jgi:hypothetical protein
MKKSKKEKNLKMNNSNLYISKNPKTKAIIQAFIYFILLELSLSYLINNYLQFLTFITEQLFPLLFFIYLFLIIFTNPLPVNIDFNSRKFICILNKKKNLTKEYDFDDVKIISLNKSYILGFSLVFMENFETEQSYCYSAYTNSSFKRFKREFELKAKQGKNEYMNFYYNKNKQNKIPPKPQITPNNKK